MFIAAFAFLKHFHPLLSFSFESRLYLQKLSIQSWDHRASIDSNATSLAIFWAQELRKQAASDKVARSRAEKRGLSFSEYIAEYVSMIGVKTLATAKAKLISRIRTTHLQRYETYLWHSGQRF